jgi:glycerol-3-phosphate dehydrogenase (NAD(P)+)
MIQFGVIGSGSWGTALAKILTQNTLLQSTNSSIYWYQRTQAAIDFIQERNHNQNYLTTAQFNTKQLILTTNLKQLINNCTHIVIAVPSAYVLNIFNQLPQNIFQNKTIISAIKGMLPNTNTLLNQYLAAQFNVPLNNYFTVMGPCHAEEVAAERLSYLTFSGAQVNACQTIANYFTTPYINTLINDDVFGVQYAAILKNIYAVGAGIAHGLDYGDNFLSVFIANAADEMASFLQKSGIKHIEVGHEQTSNTQQKTTNYAASVYLGDLLVTCYSLHSRNRTFGNMVGKGYSVKAAQLEMNMVAEGYNASKCIFLLNQQVQVNMPIAQNIYQILWHNLPPRQGFKNIEPTLI